MSMCLYLKSAAPKDLEQLARDPDALSDLAVPGAAGMAELDEMFSPEMLARQEEAMRSQMRGMGWRGWILGWLFQRQLRHEMGKMQATITRLRSRTPGAVEGGDPVLDLHKSWQVLHYLFTGTAWEGKAPANALLLGGREVGEDLGYGPVRVLDPRETADFARYLSALSLAKLEQALNLEAMIGLDLYGCDEDTSEEEVMEEIEHYFPMLQTYVAEAAGRGRSLAVWMM